MHPPNALWAYRSLPKFATGFSPFSLVYRIGVMIPIEVMIPSLRGHAGMKERKGEEILRGKKR